MKQVSGRTTGRRLFVNTKASIGNGHRSYRWPLFTYPQCATSWENCLETAAPSFGAVVSPQAREGTRAFTMIEPRIQRVRAEGPALGGVTAPIRGSQGGSHDGKGKDAE